MPPETIKTDLKADLKDGSKDNEKEEQKEKSVKGGDDVQDAADIIPNLATGRRTSVPPDSSQTIPM